MESFTILDGVAAPLLRKNIDTGVIIATRFLRSRSIDLGASLLADWRYDADGAEIPDFVLNQPRYRKASILVAGANFGCGSAREAAVWALWRFGIRCVIASSFGEIFSDNACENGLLPIVLPEAQVARIAAVLEAANDPSLRVDLEQCRITLPGGEAFAFEVAPDRRAALLEGLDETSLILRHADEIDGFRARAASERPWLYDAAV
jgi:3-isopropylmalate/(R)-2-methylmalate dehydratase small subunit